MSDSPPSVNEQAARTETGELKDQSLSPDGQIPNGNPEPEKKPDTLESEKKPEGEAKPKPEGGAPEAYADFKVPDGITLEGETLTKATDLFKGLGLTQDAAQSLVDFHTAQMKSLAGVPDRAFDEMTAGWKTAAAADPEIGAPDSVKGKAIREDLGRALDTLGNPKLVTEFKDAMNLTGVGDHPAFIKVMATWAKTIIEPRNVSAKGPSEHGQSDKGTKERPSVAQGMYPNLKP